MLRVRHSVRLAPLGAVALRVEVRGREAAFRVEGEGLCDARHLLFFAFGFEAPSGGSQADDCAKRYALQQLARPSQSFERNPDALFVKWP